ncbi:uncharacterized protein COLE_02243 [Cutaneotrichosporon oleaginosum]|uniref:uncharacterized protein n=1 Tax=Cutaneotrichosporon oleaginosum TaxID=879819 RepID=UPI001322514B|nr:hypothetical protein COLE_02243 [Cutaneotrichosporon oleaginosum]
MTRGLRDRQRSPATSSTGQATGSALSLPLSVPTSSRTPLPNPPVSATAPQSSVTHRASAPASRLGVPAGLLVPTDRPLDEFETQWLPRLGRLRVDREVEMRGYALYGIRSWYLSRTHWSFTIVAYTGKPTDISCYVLVPAADLSAKVGADELRAATQLLAGETRAQPRNTSEGTLLVSAPAAHGQDIWPIPQGDLREAWPFIVLNTALRRLGCGGRAAMGNDVPVAAVRRKFYESYRMPIPGGAQLQGTASRAGSPPQSPVRGHTHSHSRSQSMGHTQQRSVNWSPRGSSPASRPSSEEMPATTPAALERDPLMLSTVELVKLIQGALALWGFYGTFQEELELDGRFCDDTKAGIAKWRAAMGMEQEESLKLEKETSGGCIDPRSLAVLLSSVTSTRYQLGVLNVERLPKDPFHSVRRFLAAWRHYQTSVNPGKPASPFLSVQAIRQLNGSYVVERKGHASDALKVHRLLLSGVGSVASGVQSVVKGGGANDEGLPARKREQHIRFTGRDEDSGISMIVPSGAGAAAPDVITSDLEAYVKGVLKSREKDWDIMGARRVAELWSGRIDDGRAHSRLRVFRRNNQPVADEEDDASINIGTTAIGTIRGAAGAAAGAATGAIKGITKGGLRVVGRKQATYDTSDSEGGKHALTPAQSYARHNVPTLVEPAEMDHQHDANNGVSRSPSPGMTPSLAHQSMRFPNSDSDPGLDRNSTLVPRRRSAATTVRSAASNSNIVSASTWSAPRRVAMLRTASDGADVIVDSNGLEWAVANGHGTGKRIEGSVDSDSIAATPVDDGTAVRESVNPLCRSHSLQADRRVYRSRHVTEPAQLALDVAMCEVVWELRKRERMLAKRADDMSILERSAFTGTQTLFDTARMRRERIEELEREVAKMRDKLSYTADAAVGSDRALKWACEKIIHTLTDDVNRSELSWQLRELEKQYETMRAEKDKRDGASDAGKERPWWKLWG